MNNFNSIFGQILSLFARVELEKLVRQTGPKHGARGIHVGGILWSA
jgi:hypothetical protein